MQEALKRVSVKSDGSCSIDEDFTKYANQSFELFKNYKNKYQ